MVEVTGKDGFNPRDLRIYISQQCSVTLDTSANIIPVNLQVGEQFTD
jgi:hypothetical protein